MKTPHKEVESESVCEHGDGRHTKPFQVSDKEGMIRCVFVYLWLVKVRPDARESEMALGHMTAWTEKGCSTALRHTEQRMTKRETQADRWLTELYTAEQTTNIVLDRRTAGCLMTVSNFRRTNRVEMHGEQWENGKYHKTLNNQELVPACIRKHLLIHRQGHSLNTSEHIRYMKRDPHSKKGS